jgi:uracil DNA glycosylase
MKDINLGYDLEIDYYDHFKTWTKPLSALLDSTYMLNIMKFLHELYKSKDFPRPRKSEIFQVFKEVDFSTVKVVILTSEPFPNTKGNGIALATSQREYNNPSYITEMISNCVEQTIYDGCRPGFDLTLEPWLKQGVLPLHAAMTTKWNKKGEHLKVWSQFTRSVLTTLNSCNNGIIFILLGNHAKSFEYLINKKSHYVLEYMSPQEAFTLRQDWICTCFKDANDIILKANGKEQMIVW